MREIVVIAHDIRSCHNVGSLIRTAEGLGINKIYLTGYTPYPSQKLDSRLPHIHKKLNRQIHKTALGAENSIDWEHHPDVAVLIDSLKSSGYTALALEQTKNSTKLPDYNPPQKVALILGREIEGLDSKILKKCDEVIEIPMLGKKESFNVVEAASIALYHLRFFNIN